MLGLTTTKNLDELRAQMGEMEAALALARTAVASSRAETDELQGIVTTERNLRVAAEQAAGRTVREWSAKLDRAVADNGLLADTLKRSEQARADEASEFRTEERALRERISEAEAERDRERAANALLLKEHDKTLATLAALRQELAATQSARDALEANQARIRREHEAQLAAEVAAHAATKRLHKVDRA